MHILVYPDKRKNTKNSLCSLEIFIFVCYKKAATYRPCLDLKKFKIFRHIESCDTCMEY